MKVPVSLRRHLPWFNLPLGLLVALLQRAPALRLVGARSGEFLAARTGQLLRAAFAAGSLGAVHSLAGATNYVQSPANPVRGTVGTPLSVAFTFTGAPSEPQYFVVSGSPPPGMAFAPAEQVGIVRSPAPAITGTPTQAGRFSVEIQAIGVAGQSDGMTIIFEITGGVTTTVPSISAQPQSQTANVGASVTFTVQATGSPAPAYQWMKNNAPISGATAAALTLSNVQSADAGQYAVVVSNSAGAVTSDVATLSVTGGSTPLAIITPPAAQVIASGATVVFNVGANGATGFQWQRDGVPVPGGTGPMLVLRSVSGTAAGAYSVIVTGANGSLTSIAAALTVVPAPDAGRLINLSILTNVSATTPLFTLGTVIGGAGTSGSKPLLVRAAGPALVPLGVTAVLADPKLDVFSGATITATNDDWGGSPALTTAFSQVGAFPFPVANSKDAASFNPAMPAGAYTIQVSGVGGATGSVIAELYDASPTDAVNASTPRLVNVSVLKPIEAGDILTAGFVIGGGSGAAKTVLLRAIGPTLGVAPFNVGGAMPDPKLELFRGQTVIASNDNWGGDPQFTAVGNSVGAFAIANPASRDAILLVTLAPGNYTAQVSGVGAGGTALIEVYEVP